MRQGAAQLVSDSTPVAPLSHHRLSQLPHDRLLHDRLPHGRLSHARLLHDRLSAAQSPTDAPLGVRPARQWWHYPLLVALWLADLPLTAAPARVMSLSAKRANAAFAQAPNASLLVDQAA